MINRRIPLTLTVTVSGGTGSASTTIASGTVGSFAIKAPSAVAAYTIEMKDSDAYGLIGKSGLVGDTTIHALFSISVGMTITITGTDGVYSVRLWYLY